MELFGKTDLNTTEHADSVEFTVVQTNGPVAIIIGPVITALVVWLFWRQGSHATKIMAVLAAVSCAIAIIANWRQGNSVSLKVTGDEFVTQGNMGKLFETEQRIATKDALGMSYRAGGEDELSGVYVKLRWGQRCVLPRVSEEQSRVTIDAITAKFPEIATDESTFLIFGQGDQLITLGLSGSGKKD